MISFKTAHPIIKENIHLLANIAIKASAAAAAFFIQILLVKIIGEENYGQYVIYITYCSLLFIFSRSGIEVATLRLVAIAKELGRPVDIAKIIWHAMAYTTLFSSLAVIGFQLVKSSKIIAINLPTAITYWTMLAGVITMTILVVALAALRGLKKILWADALDSLIKPLLLLTTIYIIINNHKQSNNSSFLAFAISNIITFFLVSFIIIKIINNPKPQQTSTFKFETLITPSEMVSFISIGLMTYAFFQLDTLILSIYSDSTAVGSYNMACNFVRLVIFVPMIIIAQIQPRVAIAFHDSDFQKIKIVLKQSFVKTACSAFPAAVILIFFGKEFLTFVSPNFATAAAPLAILAVAHSINAFNIVLNGVLLMCKRQRLVLLSQVTGLIVCIPLYFLLIPKYGALGASLSVLLAMLTTFIALIFLSLNWNKSLE